MFGYYKKTYIKRNNIYVLLFGIPKNNKKSYIEMIETYYFL